MAIRLGRHGRELARPTGVCQHFRRLPVMTSKTPQGFRCGMERVLPKSKGGALREEEDDDSD
jgi:hypothetical protein